MTEGVFHRDLIDGGLTVVGEEVPGVRSVSIGIWIRSGSRHEKADQSGLSHFIEHMAFKGTAKRNALEIARSLECVGGHLDAFATREFTCFYARVLDEHLPLAVEVLSDIVCHSLFDGDEIEKEKRVVLDEIRQFEDTPDDQIHDLFSAAIWKGHPLGRSVLGARETVSSFKRADVVSFFDTNYVSPNIIVSVAGRFDHGELLRLLEDSFSRPHGARSEEAVPVPGYNRQIQVHDRDLSQEYVCLGTRGFSYGHELRFPLLVLNVSLGGGMSSRLFQKVREREGLAYAVYSYADFMKDSGLFCAFMGVAPDSTPKALRVVLDEFAAVRELGLSRDEMKSAKAQLKGSLILGLESMSNRMTRLAKSEIYWGRYVSLDEVVSMIEGVDSEAVSRAAQAVLRPEKLSVVALGPCPEKDLTGLL
ncbi:MAG: insulinase family protein [Candidatus Eiseniibacteriota bacterium]|nr:MAG: insulinase family protein [Candidatus Eisenbacteria bacterium]